MQIPSNETVDWAIVSLVGRFKNRYDISYSYGAHSEKDPTPFLRLTITRSSHYPPICITRYYGHVLTPYIIRIFGMQIIDMPSFIPLLKGVVDSLTRIDRESGAPFTTILDEVTNEDTMRTMMTAGYVPVTSLDAWKSIRNRDENMYVNIHHPERASRIIEPVVHLKQHINQLKETDPTIVVTFIHGHDDVDALAFSLYAFGSYRACICRYDSKDHFHFIGDSDGIVLEEGAVHSIEHDVNAYMERLKKVQSIRNRLNPPRFHFNHYYSLHSFREKKDTIYHMLRSRYTPEDIERIHAPFPKSEPIPMPGIKHVEYTLLPGGVYGIENLQTGTLVVLEDEPTFSTYMSKMKKEQNQAFAE